MKHRFTWPVDGRRNHYSLASNPPHPPMFRVCSTKTHLTADLRGFRGNLRIEDVVTREPIFDITVSKSTSTIKWNAYQANNHPWMKEVEYMTSRYTTFSTCADLWELGRRFGFEPMRLRDIAIRRMARFHS